MLHLSPKSRLSWSFDITDNGVTVGNLDLARMKSSGSFNIRGTRFELKREGMFGPLALYSDGRIIARAKRAAVFRPRYRISADDRQLELMGTFMPRGATLAHGDIVVATIRRPRVFSRAVSIEPLQNAPLPLLILATAVMVLYWRAASRAASG
jgi:hypothetical protein